MFHSFSPVGSTTGYGLLYITEEMLKCNGKDLKGKTVAVSGAGNVATYAIEKAWQLGAKPVTCSDSTGWIYDPDGIDVATLIDVKQVRRARLHRPHVPHGRHRQACQEPRLLHAGRRHH